MILYVPELNLFDINRFRSDLFTQRVKGMWPYPALFVNQSDPFTRIRLMGGTTVKSLINFINKSDPFN